MRRILVVVIVLGMSCISFGQTVKYGIPCDNEGLNKETVTIVTGIPIHLDARFLPTAEYENLLEFFKKRPSDTFLVELHVFILSNNSNDDYSNLLAKRLRDAFKEEGIINAKVESKSNSEPMFLSEGHELFDAYNSRIVIKKVDAE